MANSKRTLTVAGALLAAAALLPCSAASASDLLLVHGHIYTANPDAKWAEAIAITGDTIDAVGSDAAIMKLKTAKSLVIDLHGKTMLPGITDDHVHIWFGSLALHGFNLSTPDMDITPEDGKLFTDRVKAYAASHPKDPVLFGRATFAFPGQKSPYTHALLDSVVPDRPVVVHATSEHALFVNAKALQLAGIGDKPLPDPDIDKYVERDAQGHPTGILREGAMEVMELALPDPPMAEKVAILRVGERYLNSFGVTSIVAATGGLKDLEAYDALRKQGLLTLRIRQAFGSVAVNHHLTPQFLADVEKARAEHHDDWIAADEVKFFMDGSGTKPLYKLADYTALVTELDRRNVHVMSHALSTDAAQMALDGLQAVAAANGPKDRRFRMEHALALAPVDVPRFAQLGMIASMQPAFCCYSFIAELPGTAAKQSQWGSLEKTGATVVFSSDWPCSWPPSPMAGIQTATERILRTDFKSNSKPSGAPQYDLPEERLTVEQSVLAYTRNPAFANFTDKKLGTLEPGKLADLVVLSADIFTLPHEQIGNTKVTATMVGGKVVYGAL